MIAIKLSSKGTTIYWSRRVGRNKTYFLMPKFRTMIAETPEVATDKLSSPNKYLTPIGSFLRKSSLDELPQLLSVLKGDMSIVGPRPALYNQHDLNKKRSELGINVLKPGITGWAQINGRDKISIKKKIDLDYYYLQHQSILFDYQIMLKTIYTMIKSKDIIY